MSVSILDMQSAASDMGTAFSPGQPIKISSEIGNVIEVTDLNDDLGLNWDMSSNSISEANECQISTLPWLSPNTLFLSMRSANGTSRYGSISTDSGSTWGNAFETIKETQCEASTISLPATGKIVMSSAF
ncbi:MAG: exo-alpha-sialidase, partial [Alphaproteobacteria bacterium]|nr:exo-alpha-sialidase [Alphaproteobacteria bacterium]